MGLAEWLKKRQEESDKFQSERSSEFADLGKRLGLNAEQAKSFADTGMQLGEQTMGGVKKLPKSTAAMLKDALSAPYGKVLTPDIKLPNNELSQVRQQIAKTASEGSPLPKLNEVMPKEAIPEIAPKKVPEFGVKGVSDEEVQQARALYDRMSNEGFGELSGADNLEKIMKVLGLK